MEPGGADLRSIDWTKSGAAGRHTELRGFERLALVGGRLINASILGRAAQNLYLRSVGYGWMRAVLSRRMLIEGLDDFRQLDPEGGVLLLSNHRSYFDLYAVSVAFFAAPTPWLARVCYPVRADFFYERPLGLLVNLLAGAGVMYPPFYRQRARWHLNRRSLDDLVAILGRKGWLVGFHPEGSRGKSESPYDLLPMQPGAGELALKTNAVVVPVFINGLSNNLLEEIRRRFAHNADRDPCICVFGPAIRLDGLRGGELGPRLYKRAADHFGNAIRDLASRERELRAACADGAMPADDPRWLSNFQSSRLYAWR